MDEVLKVSALSKHYAGFSLRDVSFSVPKGSITGLIGRNGAGKSTTIKAILNLVHPSSGNVEVFGMDFLSHEDEIKRHIGYAAGGMDYYHRHTLGELARVTRRFYPEWDEAAFVSYCNDFSLDASKRLRDFSEGMKVKCNLAIALSHRARLLILDEPTSGLDPISRQELTEIFLELAGKGVSILFSTHITEDLDRCADRVVYIQKGQVRYGGTMEAFRDAYRLVRLPQTATADQRGACLGICRAREGDTGLIVREQSSLFAPADVSVPDLQSIMIHLDKED